MFANKCTYNCGGCIQSEQARLREPDGGVANGEKRNGTMQIDIFAHSYAIHTDLTFDTFIQSQVGALCRYLIRKTIVLVAFYHSWWWWWCVRGAYTRPQTNDTKYSFFVTWAALQMKNDLHSEYVCFAMQFNGLIDWLCFAYTCTIQ